MFTVIRLLLAFFKSDEEPYLGLYGAFGFDLIYQFEDLQNIKNENYRKEIWFFIYLMKFL